jgi:hypothetical protein
MIDLAAGLSMGGEICRMQIPGAGQVIIWINTRDHPGPHIHCGDNSSSWEGRVKFSFINNDVEFWDVLSQVDPGRRVFSEIERGLVLYLRSCRADWWNNFSGSFGCCLQNTMQEDAAGQRWRVYAATYDIATNSTELVFFNGFRRTVKL